MPTKNTPTTFFLLNFFLLLAIIPVAKCQPGISGGGGTGGGWWQMVDSNIGISAMHMQVLPGDWVVMFDRTDFGPSNLSLPNGHCRVDPSDLALPTDCTAHSVLFHLPSSSLRPLTLLTDTWCSSASLLPNGSLLQSGGFNDGDRTLRLLSLSSPNSSDWLEFPSLLLARRWYSTDQLLPDGRVLILGGRRQFSYEFFPKSHDRDFLVPFHFLYSTRDPHAENNLYPFLHLLPDSTLFVFANTRSVILDPTRNAVLRTLPPIPDSVPRNYPSSGSSVLLPIHPAPDPVATKSEILICGGAPYGSFQSALNGSFLPASRTCGRISPSDPNPAWTMEDMPMPRVMGDMVILPTGDVLIVNGAGSGTAGWELARDPVTAPVLYRPRGPIGGRFEVLSSSAIPRLYHSAAVLDSYGRVLVGGSNPHVGYNFTNVTYPTELSLEAYYPPYMEGRWDAARPRIVGPDGWGGPVGYGVRIGVRFTVGFGTSGGYVVSGEEVEVVVIAPSFQTHAVGMNQRMVGLAAEGVTEVGPGEYEVNVTAPATPEIAPPGYYMLFVVNAGVPSQGVWVQFHRDGVD